jgi:hypothetical protein
MKDWALAIAGVFVGLALVAAFVLAPVGDGNPMPPIVVWTGL